MGTGFKPANRTTDPRLVHISYAKPWRQGITCSSLRQPRIASLQCILITRVDCGSIGMGERYAVLQCQHENREERRFCAECGAPLSQVCTACEFMNEPGDKFCGGCGLSLNDTPSPSTSPVAPVPLSLTSTLPEQYPLSYTPRHVAEKILTSRRALEGE